MNKFGKRLRILTVAICMLVVVGICILLCKHTGNEPVFPTSGEYYCKELDCRIICQEEFSWLIIPERMPIQITYSPSPQPLLLSELYLTKAQYVKLAPLSVTEEADDMPIALMRPHVAGELLKSKGRNAFELTFWRYPGVFQENKTYRFQKVAEPKGLPFEWEMRFVTKYINVYETDSVIVAELNQNAKTAMSVRFSKAPAVLEDSGLPLIDDPDAWTLIGISEAQLHSMLGKPHAEEEPGKNGRFVYITKNGCMLYVVLEEGVVSRVAVLDMIVGTKAGYPQAE